MSMNFDFGASASDLYAALPGHAIPLGSNEIAYHVHRTGAVHVMTSDVHAALASCRAFEAMGAHVNDALRRMPALQGREDAVRGVLEQLAKIGLLVEYRDHYAPLYQDVAHEPAPFRAVFARAPDDRAALDDVLDTLAAHASRHGGARRYVVLDGDAAAVRARRSDGFDVMHVDPARIATSLGLDRTLADALDATLASDFANATTLLGAGARYALLDRDDRLVPRRHGPANPAYALERPRAINLDLAPDLAHALAAGAQSDEDPIALHLGWCGHRLGTLLKRDAAAALRADGVVGHPIGALNLSAQTPVLTTENGHRGASRRPGLLYLFRLRGAARERLWRERSAFDAQLASPAYVHRAIAPTITRLPSVLPFCVDGTALVPPTIEGASGALYGALARLAHPDAVSLHAELTLARVASGQPGEAIYVPSLEDLLVRLAQRVGASLRSADPAARLSRYGSALLDIAEASPAVRRDVLAELVAQERAAHLNTLQEAIAGSEGAPDYWIHTLRELIVANGRVLTRHVAPRLAGWPESLDERACAERFGRELARFGRACVAWGEIHARASRVDLVDVLAG